VAQADSSTSTRSTAPSSFTGRAWAAIAGPTAFWLGATLWEKVLRLAWVCAAGAAAYFGALWLLGFRLGDFSRVDAATPPAA